MRERGYYSVRTGKHPNGAKLDLPSLKKLFLSLDSQFRNRDYFQEAFGYHCVDAGDVSGTLGDDIAGAMLIAVRKDNLWPVHTHIEDFSEDDLFDVIEFMYDHVSKGVDGHFHSYGNCGMHYSTFSRPDGQADFRAAINPVLACYADGFILSDKGEILSLPDQGMAPLLAATIPRLDPQNIDARIQSATELFRRHNSSLEDRKHALRDLADVLEYLRPKIKVSLLSQDESDLFNIANNFGIRHHNKNQKTKYDHAIWYSWMFYYYLATIHACLRLIAKTKPK